MEHKNWQFRLVKMMFYFISLSYQFVPTGYLSLSQGNHISPSLSLLHTAKQDWPKASKACSPLLIVTATNSSGIPFPPSVKTRSHPCQPKPVVGLLAPPLSSSFPSLSLLSFSDLALEGETT